MESSVTYHHLFGVDKLKCMPFNSMEGCIWGITRMWRWRLRWGNFTPPTLRKLPTTYCHHTQNLNPKIPKSSAHCFKPAMIQISFRVQYIPKKVFSNSGILKPFR
jgi:hypothetical protein